MEINKLRSIIKEAVSAYNLKEIEEAAETAAMDAKLEAYDKAIQACEAKIETAENLEEIQELIEPAKLNELKKHLKNLQKSKEKLEKVKAKKNKGKEVVTDEPIEDTVDEGSYYNEAESDDAAHINALENDMEDDARNNESLNESFLKMQKLAGVITEAQYNKKKSLIEEATLISKPNRTEEIKINDYIRWYKPNNERGMSTSDTYIGRVVKILGSQNLQVEMESPSSVAGSVYKINKEECQRIPEVGEKIKAKLSYNQGFGSGSQGNVDIEGTITKIDIINQTISIKPEDKKEITVEIEDLSNITVIK